MVDNWYWLMIGQYGNIPMNKSQLPNLTVHRSRNLCIFNWCFKSKKF